MRIPSLPIEADGRSIIIPWVGSPGARYRVELIETPNVVSGVAIAPDEPELTDPTFGGRRQRDDGPSHRADR